MLLYLHIPKTAGTTLRMILDREYNPDQRLHIEGLYSNEEFASVYGKYFGGVNVISGHQYFGLHEHINRECTYITMLRDPIERVLSTYRHTVRIGTQDMGWLQRLTTHEQGSNLQTKMLAGGEVNLDLAIHNLNNSFAAVGISEMFDESILLMKRKLAWSSLPYYVIENPSHNTIKLSDIDEDVIDIIRDANSVDIQLYNYCVDKLEAKIISLGYGFQTMLTEFRTQNQLNKNNIKQEHVGPGAPENIPLTDLPREKILPVVGASKN